jgi:hypothetical protein
MNRVRSITSTLIMCASFFYHNAVGMSDNTDQEQSYGEQEKARDETQQKLVQQLFEAIKTRKLPAIRRLLESNPELIEILYDGISMKPEECCDLGNTVIPPQ